MGRIPPCKLRTPLNIKGMSEIDRSQARLRPNVHFAPALKSVIMRHFRGSMNLLGNEKEGCRTVIREYCDERDDNNRANIPNAKSLRQILEVLPEEEKGRVLRAWLQDLVSDPDLIDMISVEGEKVVPASKRETLKMDPLMNIRFRRFRNLAADNKASKWFFDMTFERMFGIIVNRRVTASEK